MSVRRIVKLRTCELPLGIPAELLTVPDCQRRVQMDAFEEVGNCAGAILAFWVNGDVWPFFHEPPVDVASRVQKFRGTPQLTAGGKHNDSHLREIGRAHV